MQTRTNYHDGEVRAALRNDLMSLLKVTLLGEILCADLNERKRGVGIPFS